MRSKHKEQCIKSKRLYLKFLSFILIMHSLFCRRNLKNLLQKEIKDGTFKAYLLTEETYS